MERAVQRVEPGAVEALARAEADVEVTTAHRYPRDVKRAIAEATAIATLTEEAAGECRYSLPRGGKNIEGPSVRLAEIVASTYGNLRIATKILDIGERDVTVAGAAWDLQSNLKVVVEVKRRITDRNGHRYNDDLVTLTCNAASSIALRNAVLKAIPKAVWGSVYDAAVQKMLAPAATPSGLADMRGKALAYFAGLKVDAQTVCAQLGVGAISDIGIEQLATMRGWATAIKDGTATVESIFCGDAGEDAPWDGTTAQDATKPVEVPMRNDDDRAALWSAWKQLATRLGDRVTDVHRALKVKTIMTTSPIETLDRAVTLAEEMLGGATEQEGA